MTRAIVDATSFDRRGQLLAKEIAGQQPDLVGLQEVALWRHGPLQLDQLGVTNAETVDYDFLAILLQDLREAGVPYKAVSVQKQPAEPGLTLCFSETVNDPGHRAVALRPRRCRDAAGGSGRGLTATPRCGRSHPALTPFTAFLKPPGQS